MAAGEIASKLRTQWGAAIIGLSAIITVTSWPAPARAGCSIPMASLAAGSAQPSIRAESSRGQNQKTIPLGENEPIFGLWQITASFAGGGVDHVISGWTRDGLEFDQDIAPILTGYVCYGTYVKLGEKTYGLTHPFFNFQDVNSNGEGSEATEGQWDGTSGFFNYTVTVWNHGTRFTGNENLTIVEGANPYDPSATVLFTTTATLSATKVSVDTSRLS
jgi:hypothetical protein